MRVLVAALALIFAAPAAAQDTRQIAFYALNAVDVAQTCRILAEGGRELNPIYGSNPSCERVIGTKVIGLVLHTWLTNEIRRRDPSAARIFQIVGLIGISAVVGWNFTLVF
jgi:hypothetical protein